MQPVVLSRCFIQLVNNNRYDLVYWIDSVRGVGGEEKEIILEEHLEHRIYLGMGFRILGLTCLSNLCTSLGFTLQRITSDASTILLTYFALNLSSTILNLPLPLCRILASIFTSSINKIHQQEYFLAVVL
jgi:hypothetical protein